MTETDLPYAALPEAVKNAFQNSEYGSWRPDDVDMIEREGMEPVYVWRWSRARGRWICITTQREF